MSIHKLTAGDGYTYLTRQVAVFDAADRRHLGLEAYYTAAGESPGLWLGAGLAGLAGDHGAAGIASGELVSEAQMRALFGEGRHPNADQIELVAIEAGGSVEDALRASALGRPFAIYDTANAFRRACAEEYAAYNTTRDLPAGAPVPEEERARIRTQVGRRMFTDQYRRPPADARELSGFIARASRPQTTAVAGFDLTFSPVKSVSVLWAVAPRPVGRQIEAAHQAAVADVLAWLEAHVAYTRTGLNGVRQVEVRGVIAAAFTHRDSRAGDPDLHTHLVVSNKVQALDGRWLALDGRVLFKATVGLSERYNTRLEAELASRLGVRFTERPGTDAGKRPVRDIVGVDARLTARWSSRRKAIEVRHAQLSARFQAEHGRTPTPVEALRLGQQATLETREGKHEPRSLAEQRAAWRQQAIDVLGNGQALTRMVRKAAGRPASPAQEVTADWVRETGVEIVAAVQESRATWQTWHVRAEAERHARAADIAQPDLDQTVDRLVTHALAEQSVRLGRPDPVAEPEALRRSDGTSVYTVAGSQLYTSRAVLAAERQLLAAAVRHDGRRIPHPTVEMALLESAANGVELNPGQAHLVRALATSGARLQLAIAPAGSGKTTAMRVLARAWTQAGGTVIGLAPSAAAAAVLREQISAHTDTLTKLVYSLDTGYLPRWVRGIGPATLVIIDEAGMAGTVELAHAVSHILHRGGSVRLVGDDQQLAAVAAGGILRDIAQAAGAVTLTQLMRFDDPAEAAATLALRAGDPAAIGFYLDHHRIHIGDLAGVTDQAYRDWATDRAAGLDAILLAPTRALVAELNTRARTDRLATNNQPAGREVVLADGNRASAGDVILTRANRRDLPITATAWVKNGDRWTITYVRRSGALRARHHGTGRTITLPADYVTEHTELGYAATIHTAEGTTATTCRTIATGTETRQQLYVALTRGTAANHAYLPTGTDGDPHNLTKPAALFPPTATDLLTNILGRDGAQHSATTLARDLADPAHQLSHAAARYHDALGVAAEHLLGADALAALDTAADTVHPGLTHEPAYSTLRAHLALLALDGNDPIAALTTAARSRELDTAIDVAAVLDWRLDPTGRHHATLGPLPWLPGIPRALADHPDWGPYLTARADQITRHANQIRDNTLAAATTRATARPWATHLLHTEHGELLTDLAVWRAANSVAEQDRRPTGPQQHAVALARYQRRLDSRVTAAIGDPDRAAQQWAYLADQIDPRITTDPYWAELAARLTTIHHAGINTADLLTHAAGQRPLPDDHPAAALWWRIAPHLTPAVLTTTPHVPGQPLRPAWTPTLTAALGPTRAEQVRTDPAWPTLVAAVTTATSRGWQPDQLLHAATQLTHHDLTTPLDGFTETDLTHALIWRITTLTDPNPLTSTSLDQADSDGPHRTSLTAGQPNRAGHEPHKQPQQDPATRAALGPNAVASPATSSRPPQQHAEDRWRDLAETIDPQLTAGPDYPLLADAIDRAAAAGYDITTELPRLAATSPLPARQPATELRYRLIDATHTAHRQPPPNWSINPGLPLEEPQPAAPVVARTIDSPIDL